MVRFIYLRISRYSPNSNYFTLDIYLTTIITRERTLEGINPCIIRSTLTAFTWCDHEKPGKRLVGVAGTGTLSTIPPRRCRGGNMLTEKNKNSFKWSKGQVKTDQTVPYLTSRIYAGLFWYGQPRTPISINQEIVQYYQGMT